MVRYTAEQLAKLIEISSTGKLSVQFGDRVVRYQSTKDLAIAIAAAKRDVAEAEQAASGQSTRRYYEHGRGY